MLYTHERKTESTASPNTMWPEMSTRGIDHNDMKKYLVERGLNFDIAELNGWYPSRSAMDNFLRVVIPAVSTKNGHVYWQARAVSPNVHIRYQTPRGPRCGALVYVKAFEDKLTKQIVVVEGPMDALAVASCGVDAVALMGMFPGQLALNHLAVLVNKRPALVILDNELQAKKAAIDVMLYLATSGSIAHIENVRHTKDLAAMPPDKRLTWLKPRIKDLEIEL